jgi:hypothetical protein
MSFPSVSACVPIEEIKSQGTGCGGLWWVHDNNLAIIELNSGTDKAN